MQVNLWELFAHPLLLDQIEKLMVAVEKLKAKKPDEYRSSANFKLLAALYDLLFVTIPGRPNSDGVPPGHHPWRRLQALVPGEVWWPAVSPPLPLRHEGEGRHLCLGER